jgi:PAS domain S-box-containing protein
MDVAAHPRQVMIDLLPEAFVAIDVVTRRFLLANAAAERLIGYSQAELQLMSPADVLELADGARLEQAFETLSPGTVSRREWMMRTKHGQVFPIGVTSVPIVLDDRLVIQMLVRDLSAEDPDAAQRTLLSLANDRLTVSLDYEATLRAVLSLVVPRIADGCTIALIDQSGRPFHAARGAVDPAVADGLSIEIAATGQADVVVSVAAESDAAPSAGLATEAAGSTGTEVTFELRAHGRELGTLTMRRCLPRVWDAAGRSLALALARRAAQAIDSAMLWQTAQRELARRSAILRISRAFAEGEPGGDHVMEVLINESLAMLGADHGGISLWDAPAGSLIQVYSNTGRSNGMVVSLEQSLSGRAALERRPVISNEYQEEYGKGTPSGRFGAQAGIAAPLLHEGRLLGVISVGSCLPERKFGPDDAEALELLAGMAASMLGTLERAQLQAVSLASRELAHRLNNDLALAVGTIDMLREERGLGDDLQVLVADAAAGLERVGEQLRRLQQLARFQTRETPVGPALDLDRSTGAAADPS